MRILAVLALTFAASACSVLTTFEHPTESGVQCDDGVDNDGNGLRDCEEAACAEACFPCGNGRPDPGELCDDGNPSNNDACLTTCEPASCGDGFVRLGVEDCDDENNVPGDGCEPGSCAFTCGVGLASDTRGFDPATGHCYLGFTAPRDAFAANESCIQLGGYLAVPDDAVEDGLLRSVAVGPARLGLSDGLINASRQFRLVTGDLPAEYLNFTPGQPDGPLDQPICVSYDGAATTWQDDLCQAPRPYLCELEPVPCGDFVLQPPEQCDDGNAFNDDGCSNSCVDADECALGLDTCSADADCFNQPWQPGTPGFACQCHAGFVGDGTSCTPIPPPPVFMARAPVTVSGTMNGCTTASSFGGRKLAMDPFGALYAVMLCGGDAHVVVSVDAGATWSPPQQLGTQVVEAAVVGIALGRAAVVMEHSNGDVFVGHTIDFGATWNIHLVGPAAASGPIGLATDGIDVIVGYTENPGGGLRISRSTSPDLSTFSAVITPAVSSPDVLVDLSAPADVWAVGVTSGFHVLESNNGGVSFPGAPAMPAGAQTLADWAIGGDRIVVTGGADQVHVIPVASPGTSSTVLGLPAANAGQRAITADPTGAAIVAQGNPAGALQVIRLGPGATMFDPPVNVDVDGSAPGIAAVPSGLVAVIYVSSAQIRVAIVTP